MIGSQCGIFGGKNTQRKIKKIKVIHPLCLSYWVDIISVFSP